VPGLDGISLWLGHAGSRLSQLDTGEPPYWAYCWAGGMALAQHLASRPEVVAGRAVLDFGCGSGLVAVAAAKAGASRVIATDLDPYARAATAVNAEHNGVPVEVLSGPLPPVDLVLVGDVFYSADVASTAIMALDDFRAAGIPVLVGDPLRRDLPLDRLQELARYSVRDVGSSGSDATGAVFAYRP